MYVYANGVMPKVNHLHVTGALACQRGFEPYLHQLGCILAHQKNAEINILDK